MSEASKPQEIIRACVRHGTVMGPPKFFAAMADLEEQYDALKEQLNAAHALIRKTIYNPPGWSGPDVWWKTEADELLGESNLP